MLVALSLHLSVSKNLPMPCLVWKINDWLVVLADAAAAAAAAGGDAGVMLDGAGGWILACPGSCSVMIPPTVWAHRITQSMARSFRSLPLCVSHLISGGIARKWARTQCGTFLVHHRTIQQPCHLGASVRADEQLL